MASAIPQAVQERGRQRVAAIMDAGAALFAKQGYDGTTMTEIAQRADTAIGSLYRFFPSKQALAAALLQHYRESLDEKLAEIEARVSQLSRGELAQALSETFLSLGETREAAMVLINAKIHGSAPRSFYRHALRARIAAVLRGGQVSATQSQRAAHVVLEMMKAVATLARDNSLGEGVLQREMSKALTLYIESLS